MTQMYIKYGNYQHPPGECNLLSFTARTRMSPRNFQVSTIYTAHCAGEFCNTPSDTEYTLDTRIRDLEDELAIPRQDWGLYHSDNSPTAHFLQSTHPLNLTGNWVSSRQFPSNHNGEWASGRAFAYSVSAEFLTPETLLLDYHESIEQRGTTGPIIDWSEHKYHPPTFEIFAFSSLQRIVQRGYALTLGTWLVPPGPSLPPPFELQHQRIVKRTTAARYPQGFEAFRVDWLYIYKSPLDLSFFPTPR